MGEEFGGGEKGGVWGCGLGDKEKLESNGGVFIPQQLRVAVNVFRGDVWEVGPWVWPGDRGTHCADIKLEGVHFSSV